jgi:hypothetical protein
MSKNLLKMAKNLLKMLKNLLKMSNSFDLSRQPPQGLGVK